MRFVVAALVAFIWPAALAADPGDLLSEFPGSVAVSPSGQYVAIVSATGSNSGTLTIARYADGGMTEAQRINVGDTPVIDVVFKTDDQLLVTVLQKDVQVAGTIKARGEGRGEISRRLVIAVKRDGSAGKVLMTSSDFGASVAAPLYDDPGHVLLEVYDPRRGSVDLYRTDIATGEGELAEKGTSPTSQRKTRTAAWGVAADGFAYLRYDEDAARNTINVHARPRGGDWSKVASYVVTEGEEPVSFAGLASNTSIYAIDRAGDDKRALWEYDIATGKPLRRVAAMPAGEASGVILDPYDDRLLGASYVANGVPRLLFTDKTLAAAQGAIDEALAGYPVRAIADFSRDRGLIVVHAEGPSHPASFYLLDVKRMELVATARAPGLDPAEMGTTETITYPSSDGRVITAYLTLPPGGSRKGLALIVMPHGGPEAQDTLDFDPWRQFLAMLGYAVLQPQFRGSDGFGLAHERAAHGAWGTLVQDDVRTGIAKLAAEGVVDASRVCIFGWSYGGYMALAGAALSPDLYKCAIAGAPVADVEAMLAWEGGTWGYDSDAYAYWLKRMGDKAQRIAASPARFAANVKIPVMLIHGEEDFIVPVEQSEIMEKALKAAGKEVEFYRYAGERHSFRHKNHADALMKIGVFLTTHLPP